MYQKLEIMQQVSTEHPIAAYELHTVYFAAHFTWRPKGRERVKFSLPLRKRDGKNKQTDYKCNALNSIDTKRKKKKKGKRHARQNVLSALLRDVRRMQMIPFCLILYSRDVKRVHLIAVCLMLYSRCLWQRNDELLPLLSVFGCKGRHTRDNSSNSPEVFFYIWTWKLSKQVHVFAKVGLTGLEFVDVLAH